MDVFLADYTFSLYLSHTHTQATSIPNVLVFPTFIISARMTGAHSLSFSLSLPHSLSHNVVPIAKKASLPSEV